MPDQPPSESQASNANEEKSGSDKFLRWATFAVDVLVFIAVAVYSVFACLQWVAMRGQLKATTKAAKAAQDSVIFARDNAHLDQRAWVAPTTVNGKPAELDKPFEINVQIKNTGKTFAKRLSGVVIIKGKELSQPDPDFAAEEAKAESAFNPGLLAPNDTVSYTVPWWGGNKLTQEQMDVLRSPINIVLVFGKIRYWDIFECEHWTTFSYRCTPAGDCYHYATHSDADDNRCP